jgi:hypothetical protein
MRHHRFGFLAVGLGVLAFGPAAFATALAHPADLSSDNRVLHKSGFVVSPASNSATPDVTATKPVVLHRSGVVVPGSSKLEYQQAQTATSPGSDTQPAPATGSDGLSALAIVVICVGGVGALCGARYLGARLVRRHRSASTRIA